MDQLVLHQEYPNASFSGVCNSTRQVLRGSMEARPGGNEDVVQIASQCLQVSSVPVLPGVSVSCTQTVPPFLSDTCLQEGGSSSSTERPAAFSIAVHATASNDAGYAHSTCVESFLGSMTSGLPQMAETRMQQLRWHQQEAYERLNAWHVFRWHTMKLEERLELTCQGLVMLANPAHGSLAFDTLTRLNLSARLLTYLLHSHRQKRALLPDTENFLAVLLAGRAWAFAHHHSIDPQQCYAYGRRCLVNKIADAWLDTEMNMAGWQSMGAPLPHPPVRLRHLVEWIRQIRMKVAVTRREERDKFCLEHDLNSSHFARHVSANGRLSVALKKYLQVTPMVAVERLAQERLPDLLDTIAHEPRLLMPSASTPCRVPRAVPPGAQQQQPARCIDWQALAYQVNCLSSLLFEWPVQKKPYSAINVWHLYEWHTMQFVTALDLMQCLVRTRLSSIRSCADPQKIRQVQDVLEVLDDMCTGNGHGKSPLVDYLPLPEALMKMLQLSFARREHIDSRRWAQIVDWSRCNDWCQRIFLTQRHNRGFVRVTFQHVLQYWQLARFPERSQLMQTFRKFCAKASIGYGSFYRLLNMDGSLSPRGEVCMKRISDFPEMLPGQY